MERTIRLGSTDVRYTIKESPRAKRLSATVLGSGDVRVSLPKRLSEASVEPFLESRARWIAKHVEAARRDRKLLVPAHRGQELEIHRRNAYALISKKLKEYNETYGLTVKDIRVKSLSSQWGSCSSKGTLNFNYRLIFLPKALAEYVVVHELCHLKEMNHSRKFWGLVEKTIKDYRKKDKELQRYALK